jgi:RNA polymerase sigma-70 factor, ECF subfamily
LSLLFQFIFGNICRLAGFFLTIDDAGRSFGGGVDGRSVNPFAVGTEEARRAGLATFRQNVEATIPALRRYARALTRDADIADDLVQDTLVRALRAEHLFHGDEVRSWLYTILTNLNRNRLRSLSRRPTLSSIEENDAPDLAGPEAGGRDIERALATLVEDQRNALLLVVLEGLSYREVAEVQGVPIGTVMSRLARARVQIKNYLDGERPALRRVK